MLTVPQQSPPSHWHPQLLLKSSQKSSPFQPRLPHVPVHVAGFGELLAVVEVVGVVVVVVAVKMIDFTIWLKLWGK